MYLFGCAGSFRLPAAATFLPEEGLERVSAPKDS